MYPFYFDGLVDLLRNSSMLIRNRTKNRIEPSEETRQTLIPFLKLEYEFYYFIRQRFHNDLTELKKLGIFRLKPQHLNDTMTTSTTSL